jgi:hypothetical protein
MARPSPKKRASKRGLVRSLIQGAKAEGATIKGALSHAFGKKKKLREIDKAIGNVLAQTGRPKRTITTTETKGGKTFRTKDVVEARHSVGARRIKGKRKRIK